MASRQLIAHTKGVRSRTHTKGTIEHFKSTRWKGIQQRTTNTPGFKAKSAKNYLKKGVTCNMTREEFYQWCDDHSEEILSFYAKGQTPSVDRKNPSLGYSISNITILERFANVKRATDLFKKPVIGTCSKTGKTIRFEKIDDVAAHGFDRTCVSKVALGHEGRTQHKGYRWNYE